MSQNFACSLIYKSQKQGLDELVIGIEIKIEIRKQNVRGRKVVKVNGLEEGNEHMFEKF